MTLSEGSDRAPAPGIAADASVAAGYEGSASERVARTRTTIAGIVLITALGTVATFLTGSSILLGPVVGLAAALGVRRMSDAGITAALGVLLGTGAAWAISSAPWPPLAVWGPSVLRDAIVAMVVALAGRWMLARSPSFSALLAAATVALIILTGWMTSMSLATLQLKPGMTRVRYLATPPTIGRRASDEDLFLASIMRVANGEAYYPAAVSVLAAANAADPLRPGLLSSPLSYRLPTLYWTLAQLPQDGMSLIVAMMLVGSATAAAGYVLARQFVTIPLALASCAGLAALYATYSTVPAMLHAEIWAGAFSLISMAFFVVARRRRERAIAFMVLAATTAVLAALIRELAAPVVALGLTLTLMDRETRRELLWIPWAVAAVVTVGGYALHWMTITAALGAATLPAYRARSMEWFSPDGLGLYAGIDFFRRVMIWPLSVGWVAAALGLAGALLGPKERLQRLALGAFVGGAMLAMCFLHPIGSTSQGVPPGYWSEIYVPTMVACIPLALAWLPGARRDEDEPGPIADPR